MRKVWFRLRKIQTLASIEGIEFGVIQPNIILPEVKVRYKYYFQGGVYFGSGYLLLSDFLDGQDYQIWMDENGMVSLEIEDRVIVSSEHVEAFLLDNYPSLFVYLDPIEPYHSYIEGLNKTFKVGVSHPTID